jgi:transcriptional regulator with XRE-family HTH domain
MISTRLSQLRKRKRWTLQYTADRLGIAKSTYAGYESGYREPSLEAVAQISRLFNSSIDYLVGHTDNSSPSQGNFELSETLETSQPQLMLDGTPLTVEEVAFLISWLRTARNLKKTD